MKTSDFRNKTTSSQLKENMNKMFGINVNLNKYSREQLEDMRNKLRTKVFQQEGRAGITELLTNETYQKDKAMLDLLNTRIKEMLGEDIKKLRDKMDQLSEARQEQTDKKKCPPMSHIKKMCQDGKTVAEICKMHPDCDQKELKQMVADCKKKMDEGKKAKPDFLDMDKDGNKKEPMKKAVSDKNAGPKKGVNPFAKKESVEEGWEDMLKANKEKADGKGEMKTGEKKKTSSGGEVTKTATGSTHKAGSKGYGNKWDGKTPSDEKPSKAAKSAAEKQADKEKDIKLPPHKGNVTKHSSNHGADKDDGTGDEVKEALKGKQGNLDADKDGKLEKTDFAALRAKKKVKESFNAFKHNVRFVNESLAFLLNEDEEGKAKAITAAGDMVNDYTSWMQRVGQYQTKTMIELADAIKADFGAQEAETFKQTVGPALSATLEVLTQQREAVSNAVAVLAGEATAEPSMGMEPDMPPADMDMDMSAPDEMNPPADEFGASDAAAGMGTTGREMRESMFARKLAESHSIMSKLAR